MRDYNDDRRSAYERNNYDFERKRRAAYEQDVYDRESKRTRFDDQDDYEAELERRRRLQERKKRALAAKKKRRRRNIITIILLAIIIIALIVAAFIIFGKKQNNDSDPQGVTTEDQNNKNNKDKNNKDKGNKKDEKNEQKQLLFDEAAFAAAQYDYDKAIETLKSFEGYESDEEITAKIAEYESTKASCVAYPAEEITHIFFHALLYEPEVSFGPTSSQPDGYNLYMTTVDEFNKIIQSMYDKGFVLVSLYDVAKPGADGTFEAGSIMLPPGKKAFVLSEDDVNYYHAYDNGGIAEKIVIDEATGKLKTRYIYQDGTVEIGNHDVVPILDEFIEQHPDFSYKGAKGILALTGYNGILGYRTDPTYNTTEDRDRNQQNWLDAHPDFNYEEECAEASRVAKALKDDGWLLASHSWGHLWQEKMGDSGFAIDAEKWMNRVYPLIGGTDIWIYPNGQDVDNDLYQNRFQTLYNYGFRYFCPVNSLQYSVRIDSYGLNMGRRNLDGYRMYYDMIDDEVDRLSDLFDVTQVFDSVRPTPVPEI